jgi:thiol:disulfide interchange protein DsbD
MRLPLPQLSAKSALTALLLLWAGLHAPTLRAQAPAAPAPAALNPHAQLQLVGEDAAYQPGMQFWVGVLFHMEPGWHVYWQNPGDSGTPPKIKWTAPSSFRVGQMRWPRPIRLGKAPVIDYGYQDQLLLMAPVVSPLNAIGPANITADVSYVICRDICVPEKAKLMLAIPPTVQRSEHFSPQRSVFEATRKQFPRRIPDYWDVTVVANRKGFVLGIHGEMAKPNIAFYPLDPGVIDNAAPQTISPNEDGFSVNLAKSDLLTHPPRQLRGILDIPGTGVFDIIAPVTIAPAAPPVAQNIP